MPEYAIRQFKLSTLIVLVGVASVFLLVNIFGKKITDDYGTKFEYDSVRYRYRFGWPTTYLYRFPYDDGMAKRSGREDEGENKYTIECNYVSISEIPERYRDLKYVRWNAIIINLFAFLSMSGLIFYFLELREATQGIKMKDRVPTQGLTTKDRDEKDEEKPPQPPPPK